MRKQRPKALIAMSGGVDSSVAAFLMQQEGYDCTGVTMKLLPDSLRSETQRNVGDARAVCAQLGMAHHVFDFSGEFKSLVMDTFVAAYTQGLTPNPCIECNRHFKFKRLIACAKELGFDCLATGHYARIDFDESSRCHLLKTGIDTRKDQSYALYQMRREQLAFVRFPLGELTKEQVRALAAEQGFLTAKKSESQGVCFIPDGDHAAFIRAYDLDCPEDCSADYPVDSSTGCHTGIYEGRVPDSRPGLQPGPIVNEQGLQLKTHEGIINFTVGQRRGIGLAASEPLYVKEIRAETNTVVVVPRSGLGNTVAILDDVNILACQDLQNLGEFASSALPHPPSTLPHPSPEPPSQPSLTAPESLPEPPPHRSPTSSELLSPLFRGSSPVPVLARHRYHCAPLRAYVKRLETGRLMVCYEKPVRDLTCGQALVLYDAHEGEIVLAGGTIIKTETK